MSNPRVFASTYNTDLAGLGIWLPVGIACTLGLAGLFFNRIILSGISACMTVFVVMNWPLIDWRRIILRMSDDGLDLDGVGRIVWENIADAELVNDTKMMLTLSEPLSVAALPMPAMTRPSWHRTFAHVKSDTEIVLPLQLLADPLEDVLTAFDTFLKPAVEA